jgi:hypothetical protein
MPKKNEKEYDFEKQKKVGDRGEKMFLTYYPECEKGDGIIADFYFDKQKVELKTDTWKMSETENFFMERFSDTKTEKLGGPFRAAAEGAEWFVYLYIKDKVFYWFRVSTLVPFLENYIKTLKYKTVRNKAWITTGYAVPRAAIEHLAERKDDIGSNEPF